MNYEVPSQTSTETCPEVLSMGLGVQSSTLALMAAAGEISPSPNFSVFADTFVEPAVVYAWRDYLEPKLPFPLFTTSKGDLAEASLRVRVSKKTGMPYVKHNPPVFILRPGGRKGMLMRTCTLDFKIDPIRRFIRQKFPKRRIVLWLGISTDEASRMKPSRVGWIEHRYPLIEKNMSRKDCLAWMADRGFQTPPSSACVFCPFRSDAKWKSLTPSEFQQAVDYEKALQAAYAQCPRIDGIPYLHASRVPLEQVVFKGEGEQNMINECEGHCGL